MFNPVTAMMFTMLVWGIGPVFVRSLSVGLGAADALVIRYVLVSIGYAIGQADTVKPMARLKMPYNISVFGIAAAIAAAGNTAHINAERARNTEVRNFTVKALTDLGCKATDSQTNFIFVDIGRPASEFRSACADQWLSVGRDFPPFEHSHARISIGTMAEMRRAVDVFREVLRPSVPAAGGARSGR